MANPRLDAAYAAQVVAVRQRVNQFALSAFAAGQYRDADLSRFVAQIVPVVLAGRRQVSALTDAYLSTTLTELLGRPVRPQGPIDTDNLRGVPATEVYARPYKTVWFNLSEGRALEAAVSAASARVTDLVLSDMQMAKRNTAQAVLSSTDGIAGYLRTLTGRKNCGMCYVASTQRYAKADLLPIHPGCDCGVRPIRAGDRAVTTPRLEATHEAFEDRFGVSDRGARAPDYRKALLVQEHGELGPVLTIREHQFTGPTEI